MLNNKDAQIVRELARRVVEIAALPVQEEKRALWRKLNGLKPARPMVMIDQVCWNEMNIGDELTLRCEGVECRAYEERLRRILFQWKHFPVDMVVDSRVWVRMAIGHTDFGARMKEEVAVSDPTSDVMGHKYENQLQTEAELEHMHNPQVVYNAVETERRLTTARELFEGVMEVRAWGYDPYISFWDPIACWMSVEGALYALVDKPEFMHRLLARMTEGYMGLYDQLEEQGLLCVSEQSLVHCTGAYVDELPAPGYNPKRPRTKDLWIFGLAQMLSTVSPAMFKEFEVDYVSRICARFGLVYYGCCDPLDRKMKEVRMIPNVRKVSMSPWVDEERGAAEIGRDYVYSRKPSPAILAPDGFSPERVRADLMATRKVCEKNGCPLEYILKDISTVHYQPERLFQWAKIAMEVVGGA